MLITTDAQSEPELTGALAGARCWLITSGKAGMLTQAKGIAKALGVESIMKTVSPRAPWRHLAPWGPVSPFERFGRPGSAFAPPWPDVAIAVGRASIPYVRRLRRVAGPSCYTIVLQDPRSGPDTADLIWVPAHDRRRGPNVITTVISPHGFSLAQIDTLRGTPQPAIDALPGPRVAVILGGRNAVYRFTPEDIARLKGTLRCIANRGASFLITASRRSHPELIAAADQATAQSPRIFWRNDADGPNPYADFLARADWFVITADSVNMTGEACTTGRPIYVFHPAGGSPKFSRYHASLEAIGATRPLLSEIDALENWSYEPQVSANLIAREIERRYIERRRQLPGPFASR